MVAVTQINNKFVHINALFIQPTIYCARNCKGCYVKGFEDKLESKQELRIGSTILELLQKNLDGPEFRANQITMAIDTLSSTNPMINYDYRDIRNNQILSKLFILFNDYAATTDHTEFHITVHSVEDLLHYLRHTGTQINQLKFKLISISTLTVKDIENLEKFKDSGLKINWNYQPWGPVERQIELIKAVLPHMESMYFILHKPDLGLNLDKNLTDTYFEVLKRMRADLSPELMKKITIDGCVVDAKKYVDTGYGCSSNISRFQIWPNGAVSGCPYTHTPTTGPANTIDEVLDNIREAHSYYEFNKCLIPDTLHPTHPTILKKNKTLLILED